MIQHIKYIICFVGVFFLGFSLLAQGPMPVGIDSVVVTFNSPPSSVTVEKAPLKYNKDFALSFQMDDALREIYTIPFPLFEGNGQTGGMYYSNGCNDSISFKMSSAFFIFSTYNGTDLLDPDDPYHDPTLLTWNEVEILLQYGWGLTNHGVFNNPNASSDDIRDYEIQRTESYSRKIIHDSISIKTFVIPNNVMTYVDNVVSNNYHSVLDEETGQDWLNRDGNGILVSDDSIEWRNTQKINRFFDATHNLKATADYLYQQSLIGEKRWIPYGMHSFPTSFISDFHSIYNTYGYSGLDNVLIATDDDILDYLAVKQETQIVTNLAGNRLTITFGGDIPSDRLHYDLTLKLFSDELMSNIEVYGAEEYTHNGIGNDTALINLSWEGRYYYPMEVLADSFTSVANTTGTQWDALVAMDYVILMESGSAKDSLRDILCGLNHNSWQYDYDDGFCDLVNVNLGNDTILCEGATINLSGPNDKAIYNWSTGDLTESVIVGPLMSDTIVWLTVYDDYGFSASDSIFIEIDICTMVDLGEDTTICVGDSITLTGPGDMADYFWFIVPSTIPFDYSQTVTLLPTDTTTYALAVIDTLNVTKYDSITFSTLDSPVLSLDQDTSISWGATVGLMGPQGSYLYKWYVADTLYKTGLFILEQPDSTTNYVLEITNANNCSAFDSILVTVEYLSVELGEDTTVCPGTIDTLVGPDNMVDYNWYLIPGTNPISNSQTITVAPTDTSTYELQIVDIYGKEAKDSITYFTYPQPDFDLGPNDTIQNGDSLTLIGPQNYSSYEWYDESGYLGNSETIVVKPDTVAAYYLTVTNDNGCSGTDSITVFLNYLTLNLGEDQEMCENTYDTIVGPDNMVSWAWYEVPYTNVIGDTSMLPIQPSDTSSYSLVITDVYGKEATDTITYNIWPKPIFDLGPNDTLQKGDSTILYGPQNGSNYLWFDDWGITYPNTNSICVKPDTITLYTLEFSDNNLCVGTDSIRISINYLNFSLGGDTTMCEGVCDSLFGPMGMMSYKWFRVPDTIPFDTVSQKIEVCPIDTINYSVSYALHVIDTLNEKGVDTITYTLLPTPIFSIGPDTTIYYGDSIDLIGPDNMASYEWWVADTLFDTAQIINVSPLDTTEYIHYATNNEGCTGLDTITVNINFLVVDLGADTTICRGECVSLTGPGPDSILIYEWWVADTIFDTTQFVLVCPTDSATMYTLVVTDTVLNLTESDSIMIYVLDAPEIDLEDLRNICLGDSTLLEGPLSSNDTTFTYLWSTLDTTSSIWVMPDANTQYYLDVTNDSTLCMVSDSIWVHPYNRPTINQVLGDTAGCFGDILTLEVQGEGIDSFLWSTGDTTQSIQVSPQVPDSTYWYIIEVFNWLGCSTKDSIHIRLESAPVLMMEDTLRVCTGHSATITAELSGTEPEYLIWSYGATIDTGNNVLTLFPAQSFMVTLEAQSSQCSTFDSTYIQVLTDPEVNILYDTNILCQYESVTLTASGAATYVWSTGDSTESIELVAIDTVSIVLTGTTSDLCVNSDSMTIYPQALPLAQLIGLLPAYCENDLLVELSGHPPGGMFDGAGVTENQFSPNTAGPGLHQISYTYTNIHSCTGSDTLITTVYGNGDPIDLGPDVEIPLYSFITLDAGTGFDRFFWSTGDTTQTIDLYYADRPPGTYTITVVGVINGCTSNGSVEVTFPVPDGIPELENTPLLLYPNPNTGLFTIVFDKQEKELILSVMNMQGQILFHEEGLKCDPECKFDISIPGLIPGMYYLKLASDTHISTTKLIIK